MNNEPEPNPTIYVIVAGGDGALTRFVTEPCLKDAVHGLLCTCPALKDCQTEGVPELVASLDNDEDWTHPYPEYGRHEWVSDFEDGSISVFRVDRLDHDSLAALRSVRPILELDEDESMLLLVTKGHHHKDVPPVQGESMLEYVQRCCNVRCFGAGSLPSVNADVFTIYLELCQKLLSPFAFCEVLKRMHTGFWWRTTGVIGNLAPMSQQDLLEAMIGQLSVTRVTFLKLDGSLMARIPAEEL